MNFSQANELPPGDLILRLLTNLVAAHEAIPAEAPAAKVSAAITDFYLLVVSDLSNALPPAKMSVINANTTRLARGQMLCFNLTDKAVGSEELSVAHGASTIFPEPARGAVDYPDDLYFTMRGNTFVHPKCETNWRHDPRSRSTAFVIPNNNRRAPRILTFSDFRLPEKKEEESD